jgi:hypothetical protein
MLVGILSRGEEIAELKLCDIGGFSYFLGSEWGRGGTLGWPKLYSCFVLRQGSRVVSSSVLKNQAT